jgi:ABC-2 type transport system permease protein
MIRLIRSEMLKVRTTNLWWIFAIALVVMTGLALAVNLIEADSMFNTPPPDLSEMDPQDAAQAAADAAAFRERATAVVQAANIYTSGQYFGGLLVLIIGVLVVTSEFHHQTATATFLAAPVRRHVVAAKLATGMLFAGLFWLITTAISLAGGVIYFQSTNLGPQLGAWSVQRAILFNLMVFALWAVFGIGIGAVIRNQIGATITTTALYTVGGSLAAGVFMLLQGVTKQDWIAQARVVVPSEAATIFTTPGQVWLESPPYWVGGLVLLGYGLVSAAIGTWIMRARDIT